VLGWILLVLLLLFVIITPAAQGYDQNDEIRMTSVEMMSSDPDFFRHSNFVIVNCLDFFRCDD
jgi:hypothetical protein